MYTEDMTRCADILLQEWLLFVATGVCLACGTVEDLACAYAAALRSPAEREVPGLSCGANQLRHFLEDFSLQDRRGIDTGLLAQKYYPSAKRKAVEHARKDEALGTMVKQISRGRDILRKLAEENGQCLFDFAKEGADGPETA